jgi:plastocyanin
VGLALLGALAATTALQAAPAFAGSAPVSLNGTVNAHGSKDASQSSSATVSVKEGDFFFSPTYIKVKPGAKLTLKVKNVGHVTHTFTSGALHVDKTIRPGKSTTINVTMSATGTMQFHCAFHEGSGMQGAIYTATGTDAGAGSGSSGTSRSTSGQYGY